MFWLALASLNQPVSEVQVVSGVGRGVQEGGRPYPETPTCHRQASLRDASVRKMLCISRYIRVDSTRLLI